MLTKFITLAAAALLLSPLVPSRAMADNEQGLPKQKAAQFETVYIPNGFDDNDNAQIVGEGMFNNACYRPAPTAFQVDAATKTITLSPVAYEYSGFCLQVVLPFERVIDLGMLPAGTYKVVQANENKVMGTFSIKRSSSFSADDYLYAPISQAFFKQGNAGPQLVLTGDMMSNCMHLDDVKVTVEPKVLVVQPIATMETRNGCLRGKFPFTKIVDLGKIPEGRYLIHVRSMNAKAVNTIVDVK